MTWATADRHTAAITTPSHFAPPPLRPSFASSSRTCWCFTPTDPLLPLVQPFVQPSPNNAVYAILSFTSHHSPTHRPVPGCFLQTVQSLSSLSAISFSLPTIGISQAGRQVDKQPGGNLCPLKKKYRSHSLTYSCKLARSPMHSESLFFSHELTLTGQSP